VSELYNINIERAVIATLFFNPEMLSLNLHKLEADDFYLPAHRHIISAMQELDRAKKPIDEEFVKDELKRQDRFDEDVMLEILASNPLVGLDGYIEELREKRAKESY